MPVSRSRRPDEKNESWKLIESCHKVPRSRRRLLLPPMPGAVPDIDAGPCAGCGPREALLPVARAVYRPLPDLFRGTQAWIHAGGAHHTVFSQNVSVEQLRTFAEMFDIEFVHIGAGTDIARLKQELRWNESAFR